MRIRISNYQYNWECDSPDPKVIGVWFASMAKYLTTPNASVPPCQITFSPSTDTEWAYLKDLKGIGQMQDLTAEACEELSDTLLEVARMIRRRNNRVTVEM